MAVRSYELCGVRIFECSAEGPQLQNERASVDLISEARGYKATFIVIPVERLSDDFFRLKTGIAGAILQKFVTYGMRVAILGDISHHVAASDALESFVHESNRGNHCWLVANHETLKERLQQERALVQKSSEAAA